MKEKSSKKAISNFASSVHLEPLPVKRAEEHAYGQPESTTSIDQRDFGLKSTNKVVINGHRRIKSTFGGTAYGGPKQTTSGKGMEKPKSISSRLNVSGNYIK